MKVTITIDDDDLAELLGRVLGRPPAGASHITPAPPPRSFGDGIDGDRADGDPPPPPPRRNGSTNGHHGGNGSTNGRGKDGPPTTGRQFAGWIGKQPDDVQQQARRLAKRQGWGTYWSQLPDEHVEWLVDRLASVQTWGDGGGRGGR